MEVRAASRIWFPIPMAECTSLREASDNVTCYARLFQASVYQGPPFLMDPPLACVSFPDQDSLHHFIHHSSTRSDYFISRFPSSIFIRLDIKLSAIKSKVTDLTPFPTLFCLLSFEVACLDVDRHHRRLWSLRQTVETFA